MNRRNVNGAYSPRKTIPRRLEDAALAGLFSMLLIGFGLGLCVAHAAGWGSYGR